VPATKANFTFARDYVLPAYQTYSVLLNWPAELAPGTRYSFALDTAYRTAGVELLRVKVRNGLVFVTLRRWRHEDAPGGSIIVKKGEVAGYGLMAHGELE
jgi:hypothetical protein